MESHRLEYDVGDKVWSTCDMYLWKQTAACGTGWPDFLTVQKLLRSCTFTLTAFLGGGGGLTEPVSVLRE